MATTLAEQGEERPGAAGPDPDLLVAAGALNRALREFLRVAQFHERDRVCCYDVSVTQCHALAAIASGSVSSVNDLAAHLFLDKSTASRVAGGLVTKGYVRRDPDVGDARVVRLSATDSGRALCRQVDHDAERQIAELLGEFRAETRAELVQLVRRLGSELASRVDTSGGSCCVVRR